MDSQMSCNTWTVMLWLVQVAEITKDKLITFMVGNLIANISYALITGQLL